MTAGEMSNPGKKYSDIDREMVLKELRTTMKPQSAPAKDLK